MVLQLQRRDIIVVEIKQRERGEVLFSSHGSHREQNAPNSNVLFIPPQLVKWTNSELLEVLNSKYKDRAESSPDSCCQQDMGDLIDPSL